MTNAKNTDMEKIVTLDSWKEEFINDFELYREVICYDVDGNLAYMMAVVENPSGDLDFIRSYNMDNDCYYDNENETTEDKIPERILRELEELAMSKVWEDYKTNIRKRKESDS